MTTQTLEGIDIFATQTELLNTLKSHSRRLQNRAATDKQLWLLSKLMWAYANGDAIAESADMAVSAGDAVRQIDFLKGQGVTF